MTPSTRPRLSRTLELLRFPASIRRMEEVTGPVTFALFGIATASALAGFAEAGVLVIIAKTATSLGAEGGVDTSSSSTLGLDLGTGTLLAIGGALVFAAFALQMIAGWASAGALTRGVLHARDGLLDAHVRADWPTKESLSTSEFVQLIIPTASRAGESVQAAATFASSAAMFIALLATALIIDPLGALTIIVGVAILLAFTFPLIRLGRRMNGRMVGMNKTYAEAVHEYAAIGREVQIFGVQAASTGGIRDASRIQAHELRNARRVVTSGTAVFKSAALLLILGLLSVVYFGGADDVAAYAAISLILLRSVSYGQALQSNLHSLAESAPWIDDLATRQQMLLDGRLDTAPAGEARPTERTAERATERTFGPVRIEFRGVRFAYGAAPPVFDEFGLVVPAGQYVGVVGPSGIGKSTLAELVLGLRRPDAGTVLVDGADLATISPDDWARRTAFVPQEPVLIKGSVLDNVRFFRPWISDEDATAALAAANVLADLSFLPDGLATEAGTLGSRLSGGQRQRIAIARALADHPSLIVLDEPTSALDPVSEARITQTLDALRESTTLLVIAHRWSTLERCDRVVALGADGIVVDDTPATVRARTAELADLAALADLADLGEL